MSREPSPPPPTPPLHVIVVGAGIVGASIAWHLAARHGAAVTVVAAGDVGGTATPNSFAWINANRGNPRPYYDLRCRSMARWREMSGGRGDEGRGEEEVPGLGELVRWTGTVQWNHSRDELGQFLEEHLRWGYNLECINNAALAEREPALSEDYARPWWGWSVYAADEGAVEPALAAQLLLQHATAAYGVSILSNTAVASLVVSDVSDGDVGGRISGVVTEAGTHFGSDHVVLAAGLGAVPLCASVGVDLPVTGRPGLLAHSKPVAKRLLNSIVLSSGPHMRQTTAGRLVVGADFSGSNSTPAASSADAQAEATGLMDAARRLFCPEDAALIDLDYYTVGERPQPRDGLPIIDGNVQPGLAVAVMHSGVTLAAIVGELLAKQVATGQTDEALEAFGIRRFADATAAES